MADHEDQSHITAFYGCNGCGREVGVESEKKIPKSGLCDECAAKAKEDSEK